METIIDGIVIKKGKAGRPKGAYTRPKFHDFFTTEEIKAIVEDLKVKAKTDSRVALFVAEHIFGKAVQPLGNDEDKPFQVAGVEISIRK